MIIIADGERISAHFGIPFNELSLSHVLAYEFSGHLNANGVTSVASTANMIAIYSHSKNLYKILKHRYSANATLASFSEFGKSVAQVVTRNKIQHKDPVLYDYQRTMGKYYDTNYPTFQP